MKVFYRPTSVLSVNPNPLGKDQNYILKTCLDSFLKAGKAEITFIADRLTEEQRDMFGKHGKIVDCEEGMIASRNKAFELACELDEEKVLFAEDDYLWVPDCLEKLELVLDELPLISPYDHPGHYLEERFKNEPKKMILINNHTFRSAPSNTHTFACHASLIKENRDLFMKTWGDHETFVKLGVQMYVPVPSWATHLVTGLLAPNVNWPL